VRLLIFVCGEGLGHTARCLALGREFTENGHEILYGAYGYSKEMIEETGYTAHEIPPEIKLVGDSGSFNMKGSIKETIKNFQPTGIPRLLKLLDRLKPDAVVNDVYYLGAVAAKARGNPTYVITNQTNMQEFFQKNGIAVKLLGEAAKRFYTTVFEHVENIIIPDYPQPDTVCQRNLLLTEKMHEKVIYCGPLTRKKYEEVKAMKTRKPHVLSMIGGFGYREDVFKKIMEAAEMDDSINYTLVLGPSVKPEKYRNKLQNVEIKEFIPDPLPYLKGSDIVITSGGHNTLMEALSFGVPVISFPDVNQCEQENNAAGLSELGLGVRLRYSDGPDVILKQIRNLLDDKSFREKAERLKKLSRDLNGPKVVREVLESKHNQVEHAQG
jgi:UDP-N-acetylglucosamine--N-acetylmuramyl-(pentapeptide) pyrophosphoryl-undecaprenol N-acetylglucosamine transferase